MKLTEQQLAKVFHAAIKDDPMVGGVGNAMSGLLAVQDAVLAANPPKPDAKPEKFIMVKTGAIDSEGADVLSKATGLPVLIVNNPEDVQIVLESPLISSNDIAMCALGAIQGSTSTSERMQFAHNLFMRLKGRDK